MFGYIIPDKPELKIKEYHQFRSYYCGLCKSISKHYGQLPRYTLSYDCVFLCLFLSSILSNNSDTSLARCITKPFQKMTVISDNDILEYAASVNVILAYYKVKDDLKDGDALKAAPIIPLLYPAYRKARKRAHELDHYTDFYLSELSILEDQDCNSIDAAAQPFANLLAKIISWEGWPLDPETRRILEEFGYNIGKWLYTIDALDDIADDIKTNNYNPIIQQFYKGSHDFDSFKDQVRDNVGFVISYSLKKACEAYESLEIKSNKAIIDNIIYGGMYKKTKEILNKEIRL